LPASFLSPPTTPIYTLSYTTLFRSPYRARGSGSISLLFFEISADFDITWGDAQDTSLPPIPVIPLLKAELEKPANWRALLPPEKDRKSTRLNSSHVKISYAVFCLKK